MKICSQCSTSCPDDASFCDQCGNPFLPQHPAEPKSPVSTASDQPESVQIPVYRKETGAQCATADGSVMSPPKRSLSRMHILLIIFGAVAVVLTAVLLFLLFRPTVDSYFNLIYDGKTQEATEYYEDHFKGDADKTGEIADRAISELYAIEDAYVNQQIDYETANKSYLVYRSVPGISAEYSKVSNAIANLQKSRTAFDTAKFAEDKKDLAQALENYALVIEEDDNYSAAQERMKALIPLYSAEMLKLADSYAATKEYQKAISALHNALKFDPNSAALNDKAAAMRKADADAKAAVEKARVDAMYNAQPVIVTSCASRNRGYSPGYREAVIIIKNNSGKAIKNLQVAALLFDANGNPVKNSGLEREDNLFLLNYTSSVSKGAKFGGDSYWSIPKNATQIKACVISITYSDGTTWMNEEYYEYWYNTEKNAF